MGPHSSLNDYKWVLFLGINKTNCKYDTRVIMFEERKDKATVEQSLGRISAS
jgi:hypothetical protein